MDLSHGHSRRIPEEVKRTNRLTTRHAKVAAERPSHRLKYRAGLPYQRGDRPVLLRQLLRCLWVKTEFDPVVGRLHRKNSGKRPISNPFTGVYTSNRIAKLVSVGGTLPTGSNPVLSVPQGLTSSHVGVAEISRDRLLRETAPPAGRWCPGVHHRVGLLLRYPDRREGRQRWHRLLLYGPPQRDLRATG